MNTTAGYVYNMYVEPKHRRRGLARAIMEAIHEDCRKDRIPFVFLHASQFGKSLYESMGYESTGEMRVKLVP